MLSLASCHTQGSSLSPDKQLQAGRYHMQLGLAYLSQENHTRAKQKLLTALQLAPDSAEVNAAMGYFLEKTGALPEAKGYYEKALALAPTSGTQKNNLGAFLCRTGSPHKGYLLLQQAGQDIHYINSAMAYENAGFCAEILHHHKQSLHCFQQALLQDPSRTVALSELVKLALQAKQAPMALHYLKKHMRYVKRDPALLALGVQAAKAAHEDGLALVYQHYLQHLSMGSNHEHDRIAI